MAGKSKKEVKKTTSRSLKEFKKPPIFLKKSKEVKVRPRASIGKGVVIPSFERKKVTLEDLEKDVKEARTLLFLILALTVSLFGLMLGIVIKIFF